MYDLPKYIIARRNEINLKCNQPMARDLVAQVNGMLNPTSFEKEWPIISLGSLLFIDT